MWQLGQPTLCPTAAARFNVCMKSATRQFWHDFLSWPKRKKQRLQFTIRFLLWLMVGVAICASSPYWESVPEVPAAAVFLWALVGTVMGVANRM